MRSWGAVAMLTWKVRKHRPCRLGREGGDRVQVTQLVQARAGRTPTPGSEAVELSASHIPAASVERGTWKCLH